VTDGNIGSQNARYRVQVSADEEVRTCLHKHEAVALVVETRVFGFNTHEIKISGEKVVQEVV
jgi:hypothetical protein